MDKPIESKLIIASPSVMYAKNSLSNVARWGLRLFILVQVVMLIILFAGGSATIKPEELPARTEAAAEHYATAFLSCELPGLAVYADVKAQLKLVIAAPAEGVENEVGCERNSVTIASHESWVPEQGDRQVHTVIMNTEGSVFRATVTLDALGETPVLAAVPSVEIIRYPTEPQQPPRAGVEPIPANFDEERVRSRVEVWAETFLQNDKDKMLDLTDQRTDQTVGTIRESSLSEIISFDPVGLEGNGTQTRVRLLFKARSGDTYSYDVLVDRLADPQPSIAGWVAPYETFGS